MFMQWLPWIVAGLVSLVVVLLSIRIASNSNTHQADDLMHLQEQLQQQKQLSVDNALMAAQLQQVEDSRQTTQEQFLALQQAYSQLQDEHSQARESLAANKVQLQAQEQANATQLEQLKQSKAEFENFLKQFAEASLNKQSEQLNTSNKQQLDFCLLYTSPSPRDA